MCDIIDERVSLDEIMVIISRTRFDPHVDEQWKAIWNGYKHGGASEAVWWHYDDSMEIHFRQTTVALYDQGKLHQPRMFSEGKTRRYSYVWLDTMLLDEDMDLHPGLKDLWQQFTTLATLTDVVIRKNYP
jgi:hypothetical protein